MAGEERTHRPQLPLCWHQPLPGHPPQHPGAHQHPNKPQNSPPNLATNSQNTPTTKPTSSEALPQPTSVPNRPRPSRASPPPCVQQPGREVPPGRSGTHPALPAASPLLTLAGRASSWTLGSRHEPASTQRAGVAGCPAEAARLPFSSPRNATTSLRGRWGSAELLGGRPAPASARPLRRTWTGCRPRSGPGMLPGCLVGCGRTSARVVPEPTRGEKHVAASHGESWGSAGPRRAGCRFLHPAGHSGTEPAAPCAYTPCTPLFFSSRFRASWFKSRSPGDS